MKIDKYNKEDKLLQSKIKDKIKFAKTRNQITHTDFLNMHSNKIAIKTLNEEKEKNYTIFKPAEEADKVMIIIYSNKYKEKFELNEFDYGEFVSIIRITLPKELKEKYTYKNYLSAILKLGINREKIGDIFVFDNGADIVVINEIKDFLVENLKQLTRFKKAKIESLNISELRKPNIAKEKIIINVSALRLDSVVAELMKGSRNRANEIIAEQKVLVNYEIEDRNSIKLKEKDVIVIRRKGKFIIKSIIGKNKKGKIKIEIEHYI